MNKLYKTCTGQRKGRYMSSLYNMLEQIESWTLQNCMDLLSVWDNNWVWTQSHLETSGADVRVSSTLLVHDFCGKLSLMCMQIGDS